MLVHSVLLKKKKEKKGGNGGNDITKVGWSGGGGVVLMIRQDDGNRGKAPRWSVATRWKQKRETKAERKNIEQVDFLNQQSRPCGLFKQNTFSISVVCWALQEGYKGKQRATHSDIQSKTKPNREVQIAACRKELRPWKESKPNQIIRSTACCRTEFGGTIPNQIRKTKSRFVDWVSNQVSRPATGLNTGQQEF